MAQRPLPVPNAESRPFWEGAARGVLRIQRCPACGAAQFPPRALCGHCHAKAPPRWEQACGRGVIASHTTVHRAPSAAFREEAPYTLALVTLEEGPRLLVRLRGAVAQAARIGAPVVIGFDPPEGPDAIALPHAEAAP